MHSRLFASALSALLVTTHSAERKQSFPSALSLVLALYVIKSHLSKKHREKKLKDEKWSNNKMNERNWTEELMLRDQVFQIG